MPERFIQAFGLAVALSFIIFSLDDLLWDFLSLTKKLKYRDRRPLSLDKLDALPPKLLAIMIAAWHEENVIEPVVENMIASLQYPMSMYHVFIGVYPNDDATIEAVSRLEKRYPNVHMAVNVRNGPTNKADNMNNVIRVIKAFEKDRNWRFCSITLHDSEDVVDPYELKLTNYLMNSYKVLQFPVIPLQRMPEVGNFFKSLTGGTYADEFAENHFRKMNTREEMSAIVPSAGTGYAISHDVLDYFGDAPLLPEDSLTEDYKLSVMLAEKGFDTHFVLEKLPRLIGEKMVRWDYVATRSFFPNTFETAVKQKTRWIYGITMQSAHLRDVFKRKGLGFAARYSLYTDLKAKIGNLMVLPGYMVFIYFVVSLFIELPPVYPYRSLGWTLCLILTFMMVYRQFMRAVAIYNVYGVKSMIASCLIPPLMPIRLVWGNIINMTATIRAWRMFFSGGLGKAKKKKQKWDKTDHSFLPKYVLTRYRRNVGDVLIEKKYVDFVTLNNALAISKKRGVRIGEALLSLGAITGEQLLEAIAQAQHRIFVRDISIYPGLQDEFDLDLLKEHEVFPLFRHKRILVLAITDSLKLRSFYEKSGVKSTESFYVYATKEAISEALSLHNTMPSLDFLYVKRYLDKDAISIEQAMLALSYSDFDFSALHFMGLVTADN